MEEPETIEPEYLDIKKEYEIKVDDNKIRIEMNNNEIIYTLVIDLSFNDEQPLNIPSKLVILLFIIIYFYKFISKYLIFSIFICIIY